jgi:hypothetical protein
LHSLLSAISGAVIHDPKNTLGRFVWFVTHDLSDEACRSWLTEHDRRVRDWGVVLGDGSSDAGSTPLVAALAAVPKPVPFMLISRVAAPVVKSESSVASRKLRPATPLVAVAVHAK